MMNEPNTPTGFHCPDCGRTHAKDGSKCAGCGSCLYKYSTQRDERGHLISEELPIFRCTKCGKRNFWD